MSSGASSSSKSHTKKVSRDRDKNKSVTSESGGSSQCDTPPLTEKDAGTSSQGKFAGISVDSIHCIAEQIGVELNTEAATNLAEDVSYKLRQTMSTIILHSGLMKKTRIDLSDVNTVFTLSDTSPFIGLTTNPYTNVGDEKVCCQTETLNNVTDCALTNQAYSYCTVPSLSVEWITDDESLNSNGNISVPLQNYYTKCARAILNLKRKPKEIAVQDLMTNTRIGPIFPNLFNLAVLVLNDDNLNALNVPAKKPLQSNVLDMVDALCSNPCSLDTNIQQQFQRLFPVMVSNILGNGSLAEKMVAILTKITRTWPSFISIGKSILYDYLSQGTKERLTPSMLRCVTALGRTALVECISERLHYIDDAMNEDNDNPKLRAALLEASTCLLRSEPTTYLEDYVACDYTLYEMLGDAVMPRWTIFPYRIKTLNEDDAKVKSKDEEISYLPQRPVVRQSKIKLISKCVRHNNGHHREHIFEPPKFTRRKINFKIKNCKSKEVQSNFGKLNSERTLTRNSFSSSRVIVAAGLLNRFRYRLCQSNKDFPIFGTYIL